MEQYVRARKEYMSEEVLSSPQGLQKASFRNIGKQQSILDRADRYHELLREMPPGEKPATGCAVSYTHLTLPTNREV